MVACSEEGAKYFMLHRHTWKNPEFNCLYDGVVYAVFVSLGFAIWENISYVLHFGFSTALVRAVTAIPGHACFGVFMGVFYACARYYYAGGKYSAASLFKVLAFVVPAFLHGLYDYIASSPEGSGWTFLLFIAVLFFLSFRLVSRVSAEDNYL